MSLHLCRRPSLRSLIAPDSRHAGLWLHRYLPVQTFSKGREPAGSNKDEAKAARDRLVSEVENLPLPTGYALAFKDWQACLENNPRVTHAVGAVRGRVVVGLGAKGPAEFGITLHHTWGVPMLPGSSLKGIAALGADRFFEDEGWRRRAQVAKARVGGPNAFDRLFGDVEGQGIVTFHDAWLVPESHIPLHRDVMTVHHPTYYQQGGELSDTDSPIPVPFVTANGKYLVALELHPALDPAEEGGWLEAAYEALRIGLDEHGMGSKTNAGYGRVTLPAFPESSRGKHIEAARAEADLRRAEEARRQVEAARRTRRAAQSPRARALDVGQEEGVARLRAYLAAGPGAGEALGLGEREEDVVAVVIAIKELGQSLAGLQREAAEPWRPFVALGVDQAGGRSAEERAPASAAPAAVATRPLAAGELEQVVARYTKKGAVDWNAVGKALAALPLAAADCADLAGALIERGAKPGHVAQLKAKGGR